MDNAKIKLARIFLKIIPFYCFRCGECCVACEVKGVPGYNQKGKWTGNFGQQGFKLQGEKCQHLVLFRLVNNQWQSAQCKLYGKSGFPKECKEFQTSFGSCEAGIVVWKERKELHPEIKLPQDAAKVIEKRNLTISGK